MKKILLIEPSIKEVGIEYLKMKSHLFYTNNSDQQNLINIINNKKIDALIVRTEIVSENIMEECPTLKVIGQHGIGTNNIDIVSATNNNILIVNVPNATVTSVVEHTIMFVLALSRNLINNNHAVRMGEWNVREKNPPNEISDKKLLVIGYGGIGQRVGSLAMALNMDIYVYDPFLNKTNRTNSSVKFIDDIFDGLSVADYVTIHVPLSESTKNLISKKELLFMKKSAFIINTSRGEIINQNDLTNILINEEISGAALDVLDEEPPNINESLFKLKNVIFTPHVGGDTIEAKNRCSKELAEEVIKVLNGEDSSNIVNTH